MEKSIANRYGSSTVVESYRKVAANIEFANIDKNLKTIMVTSSLANEGKTTTVCNLALVMNDSSKKILIIDLDLHKPSVHKFFNITNKIGLTDLLMNKDDIGKYLHSIHNGLDVLSAGKIPANPSEIINSKAIKELLKEMSASYDYILLDTPPIALVSDPITISTFSDAVLIAVAYSQTERDIAKKSIGSLKRVNANIIGSVLNKVPVNRDHKYYYSYY